MKTSKNPKNWVINILLTCLSYALLVTFLGYFSLNYDLEILKNSFLFNLYSSIDNSFGGFLIAGTWAFLDIFVVLTFFSILFYFSEKIVQSLDKNA